MRYSVSMWIYGREPMRKSIERLVRYGYDSLEVRGEPAECDVHELKGMLKEYGLAVSSVCGRFPGPNSTRDLSNPDKAVREDGITYIRSAVDLAVELSAPLLIVAPTPLGKTKPIGKLEDERRWAIESLQIAGEYAESAGVYLAVEPINRYEVYMINSGIQARDLVRAVGCPAVKMMLDTFHMNIEEADPAQTVRACAAELIHLHIADSNRQSVGRGHTDFKAIVRALKEIKYDGALAMEPLPPLANPYDADEVATPSEIHDKFAEECITALRYMERVVE